MLYNKFRPRKFQDVLSQPAATVLQNAVKNQRIAHSVLLSGTRGVGKTTIARIFAKAVNCDDPENAPCGRCPSCREKRHPDVHEIDSGSFSLGQVESFQQMMVLKPQYKYKVFIFDEAHVLTKKTMASMLKSVEEPGADSIVMLLTTEPEKIDAALRSRCMKLSLGKIPNDDLVELVTEVSQKAEIGVTRQAVSKIVKYAGGSARDALSLLDSFVGWPRVTSDQVETFVGIRVDVSTLVEHMLARNGKEAVKEINRLCSHYEALAVIDSVLEDLLERLRKKVLAGKTDITELMNWLASMRRAKQIKNGWVPQLGLEMSVFETLYAPAPILVPQESLVEQKPVDPMVAKWDVFRRELKAAGLPSQVEYVRMKRGTVVVCRCKREVSPQERKRMGLVAQSAFKNKALEVETV